VRRLGHHAIVGFFVESQSTNDTVRLMVIHSLEPNICKIALTSFARLAGDQGAASRTMSDHIQLSSPEFIRVALQDCIHFCMYALKQRVQTRLEIPRLVSVDAHSQNTPTLHHYS